MLCSTGVGTCWLSRLVLPAALGMPIQYCWYCSLVPAVMECHRTETEFLSCVIGYKGGG